MNVIDTYAAAIKSVAIEMPQGYCGNDSPPFSEIPNIPKYWWRFWGIKGRYMADRKKGETCAHLAMCAAHTAIAKAGIDVSDIDLILGTTCTIVGWAENETQIFPGMADNLKSKLGCRTDTLAIEVNQACISFLVSMQLASDYIRSGRFKHVLVCTGENYTALADFCDVSSSLFGDGAAAAVIGRAEAGGGLLASAYKSDSTYNDIATLQWRYPNKDREKVNADQLRPYFTLEESAPEKMQTFVPKNVPKMVREALGKLGLTLTEVDYFIFHQPSAILINLWAQELNIPKDRYLITIGKYSCLGAASIPLTLYEAAKANTIKNGSRIVVAGASIGWGFGAQVWKMETIKS